MQMVAHHLSYLYVEPGQSWPIAISDSFADQGAPIWRDGTPVAYAAHYQVTEVLPGRQKYNILPPNRRISAFFMLPEGGVPGPAVILFRGTNFRSDILTRGDPVGLLHDLDSGGVGYEGFVANTPTLHGWVRVAEAQHRGVVLVGHSLGGALATRLLASLPAATQARTRLLTFSPPGLEASCIDGIAANGAKVTTVFHSGDYIPLAGYRHAPGRVLEAKAKAERLSGAPPVNELISHHIYPYLAAWQLGWSSDPEVSLWRSKLIYSDPSRVGEQVRSLYGRFLHSQLAMMNWLALAPYLPW